MFSAKLVCAPSMSVTKMQPFRIDAGVRAVTICLANLRRRQRSGQTGQTTDNRVDEQTATLESNVVVHPLH